MLGLPSGLFPSGFPTNILHILLSPCVLNYPLISSLLWSPWYLVKSIKYEVIFFCSFLQPPVTPSQVQRVWNNEVCVLVCVLFGFLCIISKKIPPFCLFVSTYLTHTGKF
jgi:hypothetical protein